MSAAERRGLRLTLFDDAAGGLNFLLSDQRSLALHEHLSLGDGVLARWRDPAGPLAASPTSAAERLALGLAMAETLFPAPVREVLARQPGGWLHLQLSEALTGLPWEWAAVPGLTATQPAAHLDDRFTVVRQIMAQGTPNAPLRHREPGALLQVLHAVGAQTASPGSAAPGLQPGRFGPLVLRVHRGDPATATATAALHQAAGQADIVHLHAGWWPAARADGRAGTAAPTGPIDAPADLVSRLAGLALAPRLLLAEGLAPADLAGLVLKASRAGLSSIALAGPAPAALAVFYEALAGGAAFGVAAQRARAEARSRELPGADAWFYGDGQMAPLHASAALAPAAPAGSRWSAPVDDLRQITILSCDLVGSTRLMHTLGDEEYSERLTHYHRRVAEVAQRFGGLADDPQGDDGFMCYFGYPAASEDAAAQALRAALALCGGLADLGLQVRIGVSTGRVVIRQAQPVGTPVHHAARLQQQAGPGQVLVGEATRQIAGDRFGFSLAVGLAPFKGFEDSGPVYRLGKEQLAQGTERFDARAHLSPFTGREAELACLQQHWQAAMAGRRQVLLLRGEAGIGKSRLVREFRRSLAGAGHRTLECRCAPEHAGSAFQPMIELLRARLKIDEGDSVEAQITALRQLQVTGGAQAEAAITLLGRLLSLPAELLPPLPTSITPERLRQRTMDLLVYIAQGLDEQAPVCLLVEDVHWIDPSTRALVQRLIDGPPRQRLLLLLTFRSGPAEAGGGPAFEVPELVLGGLGYEAARALLQGAIGLAMLDADLARWLTQRADGVPLFIEESARMAAALASQQPAADISAALRDAVPATLQDLLMARLDQLPLAKRAAQLGSALGRSFSWAQIEAVNGDAESPFRLATLARALDELVQAGLLTLAGEPAADSSQRSYAFKHALVRDAAYQSMLERDRKRLHASIAAVLQQQFSALCSSRPELLAQHHAQAGMAAEALAGWEQAAGQAAQRSAHAEAIAHLRLALVQLASLAEGPERDRHELRLQRLLASRLIATAGYGASAVEAVYGRALLLCQRVGDGVALNKVRLGLEGYHFMRADFARAGAIAAEVAASLGPDADPLARIQSRWAQANLLFHQGQALPALALMDHCLADYPSLGHRPVAVQDPGVMCLCYSSWALWQLGRADESLRRAHKVVQLAERLNHPFSLGEALGFLAVSHYFRGELADGLQAAERAVEVCESGGFAVWLAHAKVMQGRLMAGLGQPEAGLAAMAQGHAMWAATGAVVTLPFYLALQAEALALAGQTGLAQARVDQALALIDRHGERYYQPELLRLKGVLLLQAGAPASDAEPWLLRSLACAKTLQMQGLALKTAIALAGLHAGQGRLQEAIGGLQQALAPLSEGQGTQDQQQARALLARWRA